VAAVAEIAENTVRTVVVVGRRLVVGRGPEGFFAADDRCPHAGASLGEGMLDGDFLICPLHAYAYHTGTGECEDEDVPLRILPVRQSGPVLEVCLGTRPGTSEGIP
jgi:nitrite reductase (NADH) small subunit